MPFVGRTGPQHWLDTLVDGAAASRRSWLGCFLVDRYGQENTTDSVTEAAVLLEQLSKAPNCRTPPPTRPSRSFQPRINANAGQSPCFAR